VAPGPALILQSPSDGISLEVAHANLVIGHCGESIRGLGHRYSLQAGAAAVPPIRMTQLLRRGDPSLVEADLVDLLVTGEEEWVKDVAIS
jgi:hypothetical protein